MSAATCDTSVLVAALSSWHPQHGPARRALTKRVGAVPSHVLLECYSVLTRLPAPHRIAAADAAEALGTIEREVLTIPPDAYGSLVVRLANERISGGAIYDGLVGATARHHDRLLLTLDPRARTTYETIGARYETL